jgi:5-methylcytosine-specific restriction protein A
MLKAEVQGREYSKADANRQLREGALSARSKGSVEYRMGNISAVLNRMGRKWISGYKPAANVGTKVRDKIMAALVRLEAITPGEDIPDADPGHLAEKVRKKRKLPPTVPPTGSTAPKKTTRVSEAFERDPAVVAWILGHAKGVCECCGSPAPFVDSDGFPFLEVHHVEPLGEGGADVIENAVALCPNCHRRCHHAQDRAAVRDALYLKLPRLKKR